MSETISTQPTTDALTALPAWPRAIAAPRSLADSGHLLVEVSHDIQLLPDWPSLGAQHPEARAFAFQRREHLSVWLETIGRGLNVKPLFVSVRTVAGEPVLLLPLGIEKRQGLRILSFLDGGVADYNAPVLYPSAAQLTVRDMQGLWKDICRLVGPFDIARLEKMPEFVDGIKNPLHLLATQRWYMSGHYLDFEAPVRTVKWPNLKESRRKRRRVAEHGPVHFGIATSEEEIEQIFQIFVSQKSRRYLESLGHPGFDVPGQLSYYLTLARKFSGQSIQLAYLKVGEDVIATAWSIICGKRLYYMMAGYEAGKWRRYSPSGLLLEELVEWAERQGITIFDFGIGDEAYKEKWAPAELCLWGAIHPNSLLGWTWLAAERSYLSLKKALPPRLIALLKSCRNQLRSLRGSPYPAPAA